MEAKRLLLKMFIIVCAMHIAFAIDVRSMRQINSRFKKIETGHLKRINDLELEVHHLAIELTEQRIKAEELEARINATDGETRSSAEVGTKGKPISSDATELHRHIERLEKALNDEREKRLNLQHNQNIMQDQIDKLEQDAEEAYASVQSANGMSKILRKAFKTEKSSIRNILTLFDKNLHQKLFNISEFVNASIYDIETDISKFKKDQNLTQQLNTETIQQLSKVMNSIKYITNNNTVSVVDVHDDLIELRNEVSEGQTQFLELRDDVFEVKRRFTDLTNDVGNGKTRFNNLKTDVDGGKIRLNELRNDVSLVKSRLQRVDKTIKRLQSTVTRDLGPTPRPDDGDGRCGRDEAVCQNGQCIRREYRCDGEPDCADGSDEPPDCFQNLCGPNEFKCPNGQCAMKIWRCDGEEDCSDGFDEENCATKKPDEPCGYDEFQCVSGDQCIPLAYQCDQEIECLDRSDEIGCSAPVITVPPVNELEVELGGQFSIFCEAVGVPTPLIVWRLNWGNIPTGNRVRVESQGGRGTLTITDVRYTDAGAYTSEAINNRGSIFAIPDALVIVRR